MKRSKKLLILGIVVAALCAVVGVERVVTQHVDSINTTDEVILSLDQGTLTSVSWTYEEETLEFEQTDDVWYDSNDADFPVNQETLEDFLSWFEEVHACFIIDDVEDYSQYGLEDPQCTVTLTTEDEEIVVSIGDYSTMDEQRYIEIGDGKVYLVEEDILEDISTERDDFMQQDEIPSIVTLEEMTVSGKADLDAVYDPDGSYSYTDSYNYYQVEDDGTYLMLDDSLMESYLSSLASLSLTDYVTYTASDVDLSDYGLDDPVYTITVTGTTEVEVETEEDEEDEESSDTDTADTTGDDTSDTNDDGTTEEDAEAEETEVETEDVEVVIYIGLVTETADEEDEDNTVTTYLRVGDSEIIYQLDSSDYDTLSAVTYDDLRPTSVLSADWDEVTGFSFTVDGETYEVTAMDEAEYEETYGTDEEDETEDSSEDSSEDTEEESGYVYLIDEQKIDIDTAMTAVDALTIDSFTDEESGDTLELSITLQMSDEKYSSVAVEIYQYDSEDCLVLVDGEPVGLLERSLMVDLREALTTIVLGLE
ncbi:MAG: DUF4340 domain-containing protein [Clostridiales bacterium]|nr:DUF4340 domain-containing protein [Clostridiales bacterium]